MVWSASKEHGAADGDRVHHRRVPGGRAPNVNSLSRDSLGRRKWMRRKKAGVEVREGSYFDEHPLRHRLRHASSERGNASFLWDDRPSSTASASYEEDSSSTKAERNDPRQTTRWLADGDFNDGDDDSASEPFFSVPVATHALDASCVVEKDGKTVFLPTPPIPNGFVAALRKRLAADGASVFLEALYACDDRYELRNEERHSVFCRNNSWIGELPSCVDAGYMSDDGSDSCRQKAGCDHLCEARDEVLHCACYPGYALLKDNRTCEDVNECERDNGGCEFICRNKPGSHSCGCPHGYRLDVDGKHCLDKNECLLNNGHGPCQDACVNVPGSYQCSCVIVGTQLAADNHSCQDIDECEHENFNCSHTCLNTIGSAFCLCPEGFALGDDWKTCEDIDECEIEELASSCGGECYNTIGSYKCARHQDVGELSQVSVKKVICDNGFAVAGEDACTDVDECELDNFNCSQLCHNVPGSAFCSCSAGFRLDDDGKNCQAVKNCSVNNGGCHQSCEDAPSGSACSCRGGFRRDLRNDSHCIDINECVTRNGGCSHDCINVAGSYYCVCSDFFTLAEDRRTCVARTCPPLAKLKYGSVGCTLQPDRNGSFAIGAVCRVKCKKGFHLKGDPLKSCLETGEWKGSTPKCLPSACSALERPPDGNILPSSCTHGKSTSNQHCYYTCLPGFKLSGNPIRTCRSRHGWLPRAAPVCRRDAWKQETTATPLAHATTVHPNPSLKDKHFWHRTNQKHYVHFSYEPPKPFIRCPGDVTIELPPRQSRAHVCLPLYKSNMDVRFVTSVPSWAKSREGEVEAGITRVAMYVKSPLSREIAACNFSVVALDKELPEVFACPRSFEVTVPRGTWAAVTWQEPVFTDNVRITAFWRSKEPGSAFSPGQHGITYLARDAAGNKARCKFIVHVKAVDEEKTHHFLRPSVVKACNGVLSARSLLELQGRRSFEVCYYARPEAEWTMTTNKVDGTFNVANAVPRRPTWVPDRSRPHASVKDRRASSRRRTEPEMSSNFDRIHDDFENRV